MDIKALTCGKCGSKNIFVLDKKIGGFSFVCRDCNYSGFSSKEAKANNLKR